ncbi:acid protease [Tothia fuscella]|uniref:Acid protease n=1 Tax=Tothia fuscella TaxID=1048955 RepID=A0A9P4U344_9PEZI|nr:acid protease [Tothia fuscella]
MLSTSLLASLLVSSTLAAAPNPLEKRAFSVKSNSQTGRFRDGPNALRKAYLKHGIEVPSALEKRQAASGIASGPQPTATSSIVAVTEQNDLEYLSPVDIGGTIMELDFDTGSSDLWVFSDKLPPVQRKDHVWYAQQNSSTSELQDGYSWKISYGDGSGASGIVFADKVTVGEVTATRQAVEAATSVSTEFVQEASDGLLGLGFGHTNTIKPTRQPTFFENIKPTLREPLFTVTLKKNATGVYDFGYIDASKYIEPIQYIPINTSRGYWEYTATGYQIGNSPMRPLSFQSIADTGTTLMLLPPAATADYYSQVAGAKNNVTEGGYVFPCDSTLPDLTVQMLGNVNAVVPGHFINRSKSQTPGSPFCYGGIQQGSPTLSIWGDVFLKSQFAVFDGRDPPRIGFARQSVDWITHASPQHVSTSTGQSGSAAASRPVPNSADGRPISLMKYVRNTVRRWGLTPRVEGNGHIASKRSVKYKHLKFQGSNF